MLAHKILIMSWVSTYINMLTMLSWVSEKPSGAKPSQAMEVNVNIIFKCKIKRN